MTPVAHEAIDPGTLAAVLTRVAAAPAPTRILLILEGPVRGVARTVRLRSVAGRVVQIRAGHREGAAALALAFVAESGWIETGRDPAPAVATESLPGITELLAVARERARNFVRLTAGLGGLEGRLRATGILEALIVGAPVAAVQLVMRCDGRRSVAELLAEGSMDEVLAARVLRRLVDERGLEIVNDEACARGSGSEAEIESLSLREGPPVLPDVPGHRETAPSCRSGAAFRVDEASRYTTPRVLRIGETEARLLREAGVAQSRARRLAVVGSALVLGALSVGLGTLLVRRTSVDGAPEPEGSAPHVSNSVPVASDRFRSPDLGWPGSGRTQPPIPRPSPLGLQTPRGGRDGPVDIQRVERLLQAQRYREVESLLSTLLADRANDSRVWTLAGRLYVDTGRLELAEEAVSQALELDGRSYRAWVLKGSVLQFLERGEAAVGSYLQAIELDPRHEMTPELRAVIKRLRVRRVAQ